MRPLIVPAETKGVEPGASGNAPDVPARARLLATAAKLFAEKSFGGVSVREICKEAGTGINMIHHYFGNKDGLLEAIVAQYDEGVFAMPMRLLATPARSSDDLCARMELVFETTLESCISHRDVMMVVLREQKQLKMLDAFQAAFVAFLDEAKTLGIVRAELDSAMVSGAMLDRVVSQVQFAPWIKDTYGIDIATDAEYRSRWSRGNVDLFLNGMLAKA